MWPIVLLSLTLSLLSPATRNVLAVADETHVLALINTTRASHSLSPLASDPSLIRAARHHAGAMAAAGAIKHTPSLHDAVRGWRVLGENVAMASNARDVFDYFMASPEHRALILDPGFSHVGPGARIVDGTVFVTVFFGSR